MTADDEYPEVGSVQALAYLEETIKDGPVEEVEAFLMSLARITPGEAKRFSFCGLRLYYDGKRFLSKWSGAGTRGFYSALFGRRSARKAATS